MKVETRIDYDDLIAQLDKFLPQPVSRLFINVIKGFRAFNIGCFVLVLFFIGCTFVISVKSSVLYCENYGRPTDYCEVRVKNNIGRTKIYKLTHPSKLVVRYRMETFDTSCKDSEDPTCVETKTLGHLDLFGTDMHKYETVVFDTTEESMKKKVADIQNELKNNHGIINYVIIP